MSEREPTVDEVRKLLEIAELSIGHDGWFSIKSDEGKKTLAALCRAFLVQHAAPQMTAAEFANELARRFQENIDHKRKFEATGAGKFAPVTSEGWQFAHGHLVMFAREHNIEIVEPKDGAST